MAKKAASSGAKKAEKRDLVNTGKNKMFAKRRADGTFKEMDDVGRAAASDRRRAAKKTTKAGYSDQGDRKKP